MQAMQWRFRLCLRYDSLMTNRLRASSLATIAATFLSFGTPQGSFADGRGDWAGYAWQKIDISDCAQSSAGLACPLYHQKWDWKRNQWVDISLLIAPAANTVTLTQRLTNNDQADRDYVCVTALIVDQGGRDLVAHHQNWNIGSGDVLEKSFSYSADDLGSARAIHIGSKQCRRGAGQDDATYANVLAGITP